MQMPGGETQQEAADRSAWLDSQGMLELERERREHCGWRGTGGSSARLSHLLAKTSPGERQAYRRGQKQAQLLLTLKRLVLTVCPSSLLRRPTCHLMQEHAVPVWEWGSQDVPPRPAFSPQTLSA